MMLPEEFVLPDYTTGTTIANVPATVAALLGASFDGLPALPTAVWRPLGQPRRVVLLILDALGRNLLDAHPEAWSAVGQQAVVNETITSVFPSTTVTCLSCLWTGRAPSQHGLISLYMYLPEFAAVGQLLQLTPRLGKYPNALVDAGLETETFLPVPSVAQQLAAQGIPTHSFKGQEIIDSALSKMHDRGVAHQHGAVSFADMMCQMAAVLEEKPADSLYLCGYWPTIDTLSHIYTPQHPIVAAELQTLFYQIEQFFLRPLSPAARQDTVFLIVADHGQIPFAPTHVALGQDPALQQLLLMHGAGEARAPYLYARQGQQAAVQAHLQAHYPDQMVPLTAEQVLAAGLLGPPPYAPSLPWRMGDVTALMRGGHLFLADKKDDFLLNRFQASHGGLTAAEMHVPFLGWRLDA